MPDWVSGPMILGILAGVLALVSAAWSSFEETQHAKEQARHIAEENRLLNKLDSKNGEIIAAQEKIAQLSERTLTQIEGSPEGYLVVFPQFGEGDPVVSDRDATRFFVNNLSDYPLISTSVMFFNATSDPRLSGGGQVYSEYLGDIYAHTPGPVLKYIPPLRKDIENKFSMIINSRSVTLVEEIVISWNVETQTWVSDYSLERMTDGRGNAQKQIKAFKGSLPNSTKRSQRPSE